MRLVLLPGMDGTGKLFGPLLRSLPAFSSAEVISYTDGITTYESVAEYLRSSGVDNEPFVIVAESFSVPAAIAWAAEAPPLLRGLVLCSGFARSPIRGIFRPMCRWLSGLLRRFTSRFAIRAFLLGGAPKSDVDGVMRALDSVDPATISARLQAILACDLRSELRQLRVPILFLDPARDRLISHSSFLEMKRIQPSAVCRTIDGPHLLLQTKPAECAKAIAKFIEQLA